MEPKAARAVTIAVNHRFIRRSFWDRAVTDLVTDHAYAGVASGEKSSGSAYGNDRGRAFSPFTRFKRTKRFGSLDGWRACAILAVLWHHTSGQQLVSPVAKEGRHGVTLFFVISGFLIITLLLRSKETAAGFSLWKFWGRRALRILPIYYAVLVLYAILVHFTDHSASGTAFFGNIRFFVTFTSNWLVDHSDHTLFYFSWSLAAEEQFYVVWPLIEVLVSPPLLKFMLLGLAAVTSQIASFYTDFGNVGSLGTRMFADMPLGITLGTVLAHVLHNEGSFRTAYRFVGQRGSAIGCLGLVIVAAIMSPRLGMFGEILMPAGFFLVVGSTVIREDNDLAGALKWRPMVWIGTISYGMYLMHMLAINLVRRTEPMLGIASVAVLFVGSVAVAVALASVSFVFYEKPFLTIKDRLFRD